MSRILEYAEAIRRGDEYLPRLTAARQAAIEADARVAKAEKSGEGLPEAMAQRQAAYLDLEDAENEYDPREVAIVPPQVRAQYLKILEPIARGDHKDLYLDEEAGDFIIQFIEGFCIQSEGEDAGKPYRLEPFQKAFLEAAFGVKSRVTRLRAFNEDLLTIGRKNGKSAIASPVGLFLTFTENGAGVYCTATTQKQAREVWDGAVKLIDKNPALSSVFRHRSFPALEIMFADGKFTCLSNNPKKQDGLKVSGAVIDEIHALPRRIFDVLNQGTTTRREPLILEIGSAGYEREGLYDDKVKVANDIAFGLVENLHFLGVCYSQPDKRDVLDYEVNLPGETEEQRARKALRNRALTIKWRMSNPGLGTIKPEGNLIRIVEGAQMDPNGMNEVLTKDFNVIGVDAAQIFLTPEEIVNDETVGEAALREIIQKNHGVVGGLDLSLDNDVSAFTTLIFDRQGNRIVAETMTWISREFLKQQEQGGDMRRDASAIVPWRAWIDRGIVRIGGEHYIDPQVIVAYTDEMRKKWGFTYRYIYYDQYAAESFVSSLEARGYGRNKQLFMAYQGDRAMNSPMRTTKALLQQKRLVYQNRPTVKWALSNVETVTTNEGTIKPNKRNNAKGNKIDPASSIFDAVMGYERHFAQFMPNGLGMGDWYKEAEEGEK